MPINADAIMDRGECGWELYMQKYSDRVVGVEEELFRWHMVARPLNDRRVVVGGRRVAIARTQ